MNQHQATLLGRCCAPARFAFGFFLAVFLGGLPTVHATPPPGGVVPVIVPAGGFAIDGDVCANMPTAGVGDWLTNAMYPGAGGGVLSATGVSLDIQKTFHLIDPYNTTADNVFNGGAKWYDNPNSWTWTTSKPNGKTDINNALMHVATDTNGHLWAIVAADRASTSGDSYIDFEFLQNSLLRTATNTFVSSGPNGGRTTNDLLVSLAFTSGGSVADCFLWRWVAIPSSTNGFNYVEITTNLGPGRMFAALNSNSIVVPFGAFGGTNYAPNAFGEAAVDLTSLVGGFDPCLSVGFKTIMIKTKTSQSDQAGISDFVDPFQYTLDIGPRANAGPDQTRCTEGDTTTFPLNATANSGFYPIATKAWTVLSGNATIDDTNALVTTAHVSSDNAVLRLTVVQVNGCVETDDIVLRVNPLPVCSISGPASVCPGRMNTSSWTITGSGTISGSSTQRTVNVSSGLICSDLFTLTLTVISNQCPGTSSTVVALGDTVAPDLTLPADRTLECSPTLNLQPTVTGYATATDDCGFTTVTYSDVTNGTCGGGFSIARTWTATDRCGNTDRRVQTITVRDTLAPVLTCPPNRTLTCSPTLDLQPSATGYATATDTC